MSSFVPNRTNHCRAVNRFQHREMPTTLSRQTRLWAPRLFLLSLLLVCLTGSVDACASALQSSGRVRGTIVAVSGDRRERLPGVLAVLSGPVLGDKKLETISDDQGEYSFNRLAAGDYTLTVIHTGFEKFEQRVSVSIDATIDLDVFLRPRGVSETVTVTPGDDRINTTETTIAGQLSAAKLRDAPLVNEKFQDALPLLPGVTRSPDGSLNIKGARSDQGGVLVSSLNVTDPATGDPAIDLPLEAVESVQVFSNPFSSEYGRFTGAVTAIETRSGSNKWRYLLTNVLVVRGCAMGRFTACSRPLRALLSADLCARTRFFSFRVSNIGSYAPK